MSGAVVDTILLIGSLLILAALASLAVWDWRESRRPGGVSLSDRGLALWKARRSQPIFWLGVGMSVGFLIGMLAGFIAGHLFWPQFVEVVHVE